jgi:hypothetical protein
MIYHQVEPSNSSRYLVQ